MKKAIHAFLETFFGKELDFRARLFSEGAGEKGLRFILEADESLPGELCGDFIHLKQIGLNFLSNAAKYTEQGSITLRISGTRQAKTDEAGADTA
jgi:signal transduction histidine kinase